MKRNKALILLFVINLINLSQLNSQNISSAVYTKKIFTTIPSDPIRVDGDNNYSIIIDFGLVISIEAKSSTDYNIIIEDRLVGGYCNKILFDKVLFKKFINALKKYQEWDVIVKRNNVQVEKNIDILNINNKNVLEYYNYSSSYNAYNNKIVYTSLIIKYTNDDFKMVIKGNPGGGLKDIFSIKIGNGYVNKIHNLLTGSKFQNILKEADKKLDVWNELK